MSTREIEWSAKKLTLTADQGLLHQRLQDAEAREYKACMVEHKSEAYILQTFVNKSSKAKVSHQPSSGLRRKQSRTVLMAVVENIIFAAEWAFFLCATTIEKCLSFLLPPREAKEVGLLATCMAMILMAFAAAGEAPRLYSSMRHAVLSHNAVNHAGGTRVGISHAGHKRNALAQLRSLL